MTALEGALAEQVTVNLTYEDSDGRVTRREVEPMIFALAGGRWYLVGWCRLRRDVRWFRLERVKGAVATRTASPPRAVSTIGTPPPSAHTVET
jgi:Predicted transcriptional regulator